MDLNTFATKNSTLIKGSPEYKTLYEKTLPDGMLVDLSQDPLLRELVEGKHNFRLIGGAVIDIIDGRKPKDYDFTQISDNTIGSLGFDFCYETATAVTYKRKADNLIIQVLHTSTSSFDFTISCSRISGDYSFGKYSLGLQINDKNSYLHKLLVPQSYEPKAALNALMRIPHWRKKGYEIHDMTYFSLLRAVASIDGLSIFKGVFKNS